MPASLSELRKSHSRPHFDDINCGTVNPADNIDYVTGRCPRARLRFVTGDEIYCTTIDYADKIDYVK